MFFKILSSPETNMRDAQRGIFIHSIDEDMNSEKSRTYFFQVDFSVAFVEERSLLEAKVTNL